jgi:hypothetical protein
MAKSEQVLPRAENISKYRTFTSDFVLSSIAFMEIIKTDQTSYISFCNRSIQILPDTQLEEDEQISTT